MSYYAFADFQKIYQINGIFLSMTALIEKCFWIVKSENSSILKWFASEKVSMYNSFIGLDIAYQAMMTHFLDVTHQHLTTLKCPKYYCLFKDIHS